MVSGIIYYDSLTCIIKLCNGIKLNKMHLLVNKYVKMAKLLL